jgi:hypothetical protein
MFGGTGNVKASKRPVSKYRSSHWRVDCNNIKRLFGCMAYEAKSKHFRIARSRYSLQIIIRKKNAFFPLATGLVNINRIIKLSLPLPVT